MKFFENCSCGVLFLILFLKTCSANAIDDGFLNVTCNKASDCYVLDNVNQGLQLACWHNVQKCKCQNTISSSFNLKWENKQCLMSKYGPCGAKGQLAVGCQDGFICVNNECRDPNDVVEAVKVVPYVFDESKCSTGACTFSKDLDLTCNYNSNHCECRQMYTADKRDTLWDIRNYDGSKNCSVGLFGPCGIKNGIKIDCHGDGIICVNGICVNAYDVFSEIGENCEGKNCKEGLMCSLDLLCIEPFSLRKYKRCSSDNQCQKGLICQRITGKGFRDFKFCR